MKGKKVAHHGLDLFEELITKKTSKGLLRIKQQYISRKLSSHLSIDRLLQGNFTNECLHDKYRSEGGLHMWNPPLAERIARTFTCGRCIFVVATGLHIT